MKYIEQACVYEFEGKEFESGGAFVSDTHVIAYLSVKDDTLTDWHGRALGTYRITHSWRLPWNCYTSTHMHQVEVIVNHITYTGRSCGKGMLYRGRRKKG